MSSNTDIVDADTFQDPSSGKHVTLYVGRTYRVSDGPHKGFEGTYRGWSGPSYTRRAEIGAASVQRFVNPTLLTNLDGTRPRFDFEQLSVNDLPCIDPNVPKSADMSELLQALREAEQERLAAETKMSELLKKLGY